MAQDDADGPKGSSWHSWVGGSTRQRLGEGPIVAPASAARVVDDPEPEPASDAEKPDDLDVTLSWPGGDAASDNGPPEAATDEPGDDHRAAVPGPAFRIRDADDEGGEDDGDLLPAVPLLPTIAGRVDALGAMLRTIAMRVDSLAATTNGFRSAVSDRIDEYADVVAGLGRQSEQSLDDYRRASERQVAELRRGLADHDELLHRATGLLEEVATDVASLIDLVRLGVAGQRAAGVVPAPPGGPAGPDLVEELESVRHDLGYLRGMVDVIVDTMPASAEGSAGAMLTDEQLDLIVERLAAKLGGDQPSPAAPVPDAAPPKPDAAFALPPSPSGRRGRSSRRR